VQAVHSNLKEYVAFTLQDQVDMFFQNNEKQSANDTVSHPSDFELLVP
jgi:hypothetical protein